MLVWGERNRHRGSLNRASHTSTLHCFIAGFLRPNPDGFINRVNEHFTVTDFAGFGGFHDGGDGGFDEPVRENDFDFDFGQEVDGVLASAVDFGVALLASETFHLGDRHAFDADFGERFFHFLKFERFDDRFDFLHGFRSVVAWAAMLNRQPVGVFVSVVVLRASRLEDVTFFSVVGHVESGRFLFWSWA